MADSKEKLFADFTAPTRQEWRDKIEVDLKGADYEKKMVWRTNEGFSMQPFYRKEDVDKLPTVNALPGEFPYVRGNKKDNNQWFVRQNIEATDAEAANAKALDILNKGVTSLGFQMTAEQCTKEFVSKLLDGIYADCVELNFCICPCHARPLALLLVELFTEKGYDLTKLQGSINFDPISAMLRKGKDTTEALQFAKPLIEALAPLPGYRCINVNADLLNNAGAYVYQELGYALAWGGEYLDELVEAGVPAEEAARRIKFNFGISGVYFMEIAKFRAARMLWAEIVKQYTADKDAAKMNVCATTSTFNLTLFDSYVNMLRTQTETMSAAIANVDSIVVTPFDVPYEQPTEFAERIARNQQLLLKEECHFDKLVDVSGGSYFVEELTVSIAQQAWKLFLAVEEEGGFLAAAKGRFHPERHQRYQYRPPRQRGQAQGVPSRYEPVPQLHREERGQATCYRLPRMLWHSRDRGERDSGALHASPRFRLRSIAPHYGESRKAARGLHADHRQPGHASGSCPVQLQLPRRCRLQGH